MPEAVLRPVWAEVDLDAVRHNVRTMAELVHPAEVLAVVKADGYGRGAEPVAKAALEAGATRLGVAVVDEGVALRQARIDAPILVLAEPATDAMHDAVVHRLTPAVYSRAAVERLTTEVGRR